MQVTQTSSGVDGRFAILVVLIVGWGGTCMSRRPKTNTSRSVFMHWKHVYRAALLVSLTLGIFNAAPARGDGDMKKVKHVIVIMQENHSFDNYFGALAYAPGSPYHTPDQDLDRARDGDDSRGCSKDDHRCVD